LNSTGFFGSQLNRSGLPEPDASGSAPPVGKNRIFLYFFYLYFPKINGLLEILQNIHLPLRATV
jgi:hypothetical protein